MITIVGTSENDTLSVPVRGQYRGETYRMYGEEGNDRLTGSRNDDRLYGGADNDTLIGGDGADLLHGGTGHDWANYQSSWTGVNVSLKDGRGHWGDAEGDTLVSIESVTGSNHADSLTGDDGKNSLIGLGGNDYLNGGRGDDFLVGGEGDDYMIGGAGADHLIGGNGSDTVSYASETTYAYVDLESQDNAGSAAGDRIESVENLEGSGTYDVFFGNDGVNHLKGLAGGDILGGRAGADILDGGSGYDFAWYEDARSGVTVDLALGLGSRGEADGDQLISIEGVLGSRHADSLAGDDRDNGLYGRDGNDALFGRAGNDVLNGEAGRDRLYGGAGNDQMFGGEGDDLFADVNGFDVFNGGGGHDTVDYDAASERVIVDLRAGTGGYGAQGDTFTAIESVWGSNFGDFLYGSQGSNMLDGDDGNDVLEGRGGADTLIGGGGEDFASYSGSASGVKVSLATGTGSQGDAAGDTLSEIEHLIGSAHDDILTGNEGDNTLRGLDGDDLLIGGAGYGPESADLLVGGRGLDSLFGGTGDDTFQFQTLQDSGKTAATADVILDFHSGDVIDLHLIDARPDLEGNQGFTFIEGDAFTAIGQVRSYTDGANTFVQLNTAAGSAPEMLIRVEGVVTLTAADFIL